MGEEPWLWRKFPFKFTNVRKFQQFLEINRFSALESLKIREGFYTNEENVEIFKTIRQKQSIKNLEMKLFVNMDCDTHDVVDTLAGLESVTLWTYANANELMETLFNKMLGKIKLKTMCINFPNLQHIKPEVVAQSVNNLENFQLTSARMSTQQLDKIFEVMNKQTRLRRLSLDVDIEDIGIKLFTADYKTFAHSVNKLQEFSIAGHFLVEYITHEHVNAMLNQCLVQTNLRILKIPNLDLSLVDPTVLARCVNKMEKVHLSNNNLGKQHL